MSAASSSPVVIQLPTPMVLFDSQPWAEAGAFGSSFVGNRALFVKLSDASAELYENPDLDARIELLRYRERKVDRRTAGFVHPAHTVGGVNPQDDGRRTRGGVQYDDGGNPMNDRETEWSLIGLDDHQRIEIPFWQWFSRGSIHNELTSESFSVPTLTGSKLTNYDSGKFNPRWVGRRMDLYLRFRVTIQDPDGDGTLGDRLVGPESATVRVAPYPYPIHFDGGSDSNRLGVGMAGSPIYG